MKRGTTAYIFAAVALLNIWYGLHLMNLAGRMSALFESAIGEYAALPWLTHHLLALAWWPYVCALLCVAGAATALLTKSKDLTLSRCLVLLLVLETFFLFATVFAYCYPWLPMTIRVVE